MQLAKLMELRSNFNISSKDKEELMFADQTYYQNRVREICSGEAIQLQINIVNFNREGVMIIKKLMEIAQFSMYDAII